MMLCRRLYDIFVMLIFVATAVRGLNVTRCPRFNNDSFTCPGLFDPPERTFCCLSDGQPACCLPGGTICTDSHSDKRNYCPGTRDGREQTQCCVWNGKPACCLQGGSLCSDNADIRSHCPGADHGSERTRCCIWDKQPTCCLPGGSSCDDNSFRDYCPGPNDEKEYVGCCDDVKKCCTRKKSSTTWIIFGVVLFLIVVSVCVGCFFKNAGCEFGLSC